LENKIKGNKKENNKGVKMGKKRGKRFIYVRVSIGLALSSMYS
jgi:hypothetical protein